MNVFEGYYKLRDEKQNPLRKNFIVFYNNGKVGNFLDYLEDDLDFNPKKAEMGFFGIKNNQQFYYLLLKLLISTVIILFQVIKKINYLQSK